MSSVEMDVQLYQIDIVMTKLAINRTDLLRIRRMAFSFNISHLHGNLQIQLD